MCNEYIGFSMNILKIVSFIFLCGVTLMQNAQAMAPITPDARLIQLSRSLMQDKSLANAIQVRNQANIIKAQVATDDDIKLTKRASDLVRRAQSVINQQEGMALDNARQRRLAGSQLQMSQNWTRLDQEMPDLSRLNFHPAN